MTQRALHVWLPIAGIVLAAWVFLALMGLELARLVSIGALGPGMTVFEALTADVTFAVGSICRPMTNAELINGGWVSFARIVAMWSIMTIAMMLPTAVPLIATYTDFSIGNPARVPPRQIWTLVGGYLVVWLGFSFVASTLQVALSRAALMSDGLVVNWPLLSAAFLVLAGLYQFTPLKAACLARCRTPLPTFLGMWRDGMTGALAMGVRQGLFCLGCCWALMLLAFVGGVMNIVWMTIAMVFMALEKLPVPGERLTTLLGALLIAGGGYMTVQAFG